MTVERFAPSPTGALHLGHAFSALTAWRAARSAGGRFLLRLEDLDRSRVREEHAHAIETDLAWLGIDWDGPVLCQSTRLDAYSDALSALHAKGLIYPCRCTRRDIAEAIRAPQEGVEFPGGPDGPVYPGTCRPGAEVTRSISDPDAALRLDMARAVASLGGIDAVAALTFEEIGDGVPGDTGSIGLEARELIEEAGDIVLRRKDGATAYHLAVVVDDAAQGVTHVTRGADLFPATKLHRLLQALLDLPVPTYRHHRLIRDAEGRRLAKRDNARALSTLRNSGKTASDIREQLGFQP